MLQDMSELHFVELTTILNQVLEALLKELETISTKVNCARSL